MDTYACRVRISHCSMCSPKLWRGDDSSLRHISSAWILQKQHPQNNAITCVTHPRHFELHVPPSWPQLIEYTATFPCFMITDSAPLQALNQLVVAVTTEKGVGAVMEPVAVVLPAPMSGGAMHGIRAWKTACLW